MGEREGAAREVRITATTGVPRCRRLRVLLLGGGAAAFRARLRGLRGHPVVVNKWASWCGPCRSEFPYFQRLGVELGRRVAFLGVDGNDNDSDSRRFLRR